MSTRAMTWAFGQRVGSPMAKLVPLALANHHDDETGADPFPAIRTIAAETEMNERSVRRHLEALEAAGRTALPDAYPIPARSFPEASPCYCFRTERPVR